MIEQTLEDRVLYKISSALAGSGVGNVQTLAQLRASEGVKATEKADADVYIVAKSSPRSYSTATIPTCQIDISLNVLVRADVDYNGAGYLGVTSKIMDVLQHWQRCYQDTHEDFAIEGEFSVSGFQLGSGSFALDSSAKTWQYTHSFSVFGVVLGDNYNTTNQEVITS